MIFLLLVYILCTCLNPAETCGRIKYGIPENTQFNADKAKDRGQIHYSTPWATVDGISADVRRRYGPGSGDYLSESDGKKRIKYDFYYLHHHESDAFEVWVKAIRCQQDVIDAKNFPNGSTNCRNDCNIPNAYGTVCVPSCYRTLKLSHKNKVECKSNGAWSTTFPYCEDKLCTKQPEDPKHGFWTCPGNPVVGSSCELGCNEGFKSEGSPVIHCQESEEWTISESSKCTDVQPPTFVGDCSAMDRTVIVGPRSAPVEATWNDISATDNSGDTVTVTYRPQNGSSLGLGNHTVHVTASDASQNSASCSFTITAKTFYCDELSAPENGHMQCTQTPTNVYGSRCDFGCYPGYEIPSPYSHFLTCIHSDTHTTWDGVPPKCTEISCNELPHVANGTFTCDDGRQFMDMCRLNCSTGYILQDPVDITCQANKTWTQAGSCRDVEPPSFSEDCQSRDKEVFASALGKPTIVEWTEIQALDNSNQHVTVTSKPASGSEFQVGTTTVTVTATDTSGNERVCHFTITVTTLTCEEPALEEENSTFKKMVYHRSADGYVYGASWNVSCRQGYPMRGSTIITCDVDNSTHPPETRWTWPGDHNAMKPTCLDVICPKLDPPVNGALSCFPSTGGTECLMSCHKNFTVPRIKQIANGRLTCPNSKAFWIPSAAPNCIQRVIPGRVAIQTDIFYYTGSCNQSIPELQAEFLKRISDIDIAKDACVTVPACVPDNIVVTCGPLQASGKRRKRSSQEEFLLQISFDLKIPFEDSPDAMAKYEVVQSKLTTSLQQKATDGDLNFQGLTADEYSVGMGNIGCDCTSGTVCTMESSLGTMSCVGCSKGHFMPENDTDCYECPRGSYQSNDIAVACTPCPPGMSTVSTASHNITQCQELCLPGHASEDGFAPCRRCPVASYQAEAGSTFCYKCPFGTTTLSVGSLRAESCQAADLVFINKYLTYNFTSSKATLAAWMTLPLTSSVLSISVLHDAGHSTVITFRHSGSGVEYGRDASAFPISADIRKDNWFYIAITNDYSANSSKVYLNGQLLPNYPADMPQATSLSGRIDGKVIVSSVIATDKVIDSGGINSAAATCDFSTTNTELISLISLPSYATSRTCDAIDDCASNPCGSHPCENRLDGYVCHCENGWTGDQCQTPPDYCQNNTCRNGATCVSSLTNFTCVCPEGLTGRFCQREIGAGGWGAWNIWSDCTLTCGGGVQTRQRRCNNPPPQAGGKNCVGATNETQICGLSLCPVNGGWSQWSEWNECSVTCGGGKTTRSRQCDKPTPKHGGLMCDGDPEDVKACGTDLCPVHGVWGEWSDWGQCSASCEGGEQSRDRLCDSPRPMRGGRNCTGDSNQRKMCNTHECPVCPNFPRLPNTLRPKCNAVGSERNCTVICLPTYVWAMTYEAEFYCGAKTNFTWSLDPHAPLSFEDAMCSKQHLYEGGQMQVSFLLDQPCSPDNEAGMDEVRKQIASNTASLPCANLEPHKCITEVSVTCIVPPPSTNITRHRRSADADSGKRVQVHFEMSGDLKDSNQVDTNSSTYAEYLDLIKATEESVKLLLENTDSVFSITVNGQTLKPIQDSIDMSGGYHCPPGTGQRNGFCVDCPTGTYEVDSRCNFCPKDQYQDEVGKTSCKPCPTGFSWETLGAISIEQCIVSVSQPLEPGSDDKTVIGIAVGVSAAVLAVAVASVIAILYKMKRLKLKKLTSSMLSLNRVHPDTARRDDTWK